MDVTPFHGVIQCLLWRFFAVPNQLEFFINDISDLNELTLKNIKFFFDNYKRLEKGKNVEVGEFHGKEEALKIYEQSKTTHMEGLL